MFHWLKALFEGDATSRAVPTWIQYSEPLAGENSPTYSDVLNRAVKEFWANFLVGHDEDGNHTITFPAEADVDLNTTHRGRIDNPHSVTAAQVDAPTNADLSDHTGNVSNPHSVTAAQTGALVQADLDTHTGDTNNPHSVTAAQINAVSVVTSDTTISVSQTGNDITGDGTSGTPYASLHKALETLEGKVLRANITISLADGIYTGDALTISHPDASQIAIVGQGAASTKTLQGFWSYTQPDWWYDVTLSLDDVTGIAIGDYIVIRNPSGGVNPTYIAGAHEVTGIDAVNHRITIMYMHNTGVPGGAITGTVEVFKTIVKHPITIRNTTLKQLDALVMAAPGDTSTFDWNLMAFTLTNAHLMSAGFAVSRGWGGVKIEHDSTMIGDGVIVSGCNNGVEMSGNSYCELANPITSGNWGYGLSISMSRALWYPGGIMTGNYDGVYAERGSWVKVFGKMTGHPGTALNAKEHSYIDRFQLTLENNGTDYNPTLGTEGNNGAWIV